MRRVWALGRHLLVCGDSSDPATEEVALANIFDVGCLVFDPPWQEKEPHIPGVSIVNALVFTTPSLMGQMQKLFGGPPPTFFIWDRRNSWAQRRGPLRRACIALCYGGGNNSYNPCAAHYGNPEDAKPYKVKTKLGEKIMQPCEGKHLADIYEEPVRATRKEAGFKYAKPLDWVRMLIGNCSSGLVLDPYAGSGQTLLACEQLGRPSVNIEVEPGLCTSIIARWEKMTGGKAHEIRS